MLKDISLSDLEPAIEIFKDSSLRATQKVVNRAEKRALAAAKSQARGTNKTLREGKIARALKKTLKKAMAFHGRQAKDKPSIRLTAPDTGGRPYHFGYTVITRGQRKATLSSARRAGTEGRAAGSARQGNGARKSAAGRNAGHNANTRECAHQLYTEREEALEAGQALDERPLAERSTVFMERTAIDGARIASGAKAPRAGREADAGEAERGQERGQDNGQAASRAWVEEGMSLASRLSERHSEAAAQNYIENPDKLPKVRGHTASFGTIGDTQEERLRFWDLVHEHESDKGGRTQSRLVLELPHEASAQERHEIVRRYTDDMFRAKGLPYWVSIHAPTKENDSRNHHAHVVFTDRPTLRMVDPSTGLEEWDFAIAVAKQTKCRHRIVTHPHRQTRRKDMRDKGWVQRARTQFAEVTNDVMIEAGKAVRYDPRSYKDMGLDADPMRNVKRIIMDKAKGQTFVVMDADWTRRMIDQEMRDAAIRRSATFQAMVEIEGLLEKAPTNAAFAERAEARLPAHLRMGMPMRLGTAISRRVTTAVLENERERLARRFVQEATERTLRHVMEATRPQPKARAAGKVHNPANAPDAEALAELHTAAREELVAHKKSVALAAAAAARRMEVLRGLWGSGQPKAPRATATPDPETPARPTPQGRAGSDQGIPEADRLQATPRTPATEPPRVPQGLASRLTPVLVPRLVPDFLQSGLAREVSARMSALVERYAESLAASQTLEQRLRDAGVAERLATTKLAALDAEAARRLAEAPPASQPQAERAPLPPHTPREPVLAQLVRTAPGLPLPAPMAATASAKAAQRTVPPHAPKTEIPDRSQPAPAMPLMPLGRPANEKPKRDTSPEASEMLPDRTPPAPKAIAAEVHVDQLTSNAVVVPAPPISGSEPDPDMAAEAAEAAKKKARRKAIMASRGRGGPSR